IVGQSVLLSGEPYLVIGVLPDLPRVSPDEPEIWVPLVLAAVSNGRSAHTLNVFGRLKPSVTLEQAQAEMNTIAARLEREYPNENTGHGVNVFALHDETVASNVRAAMLILLGATGLVLLIACANIANLSLVRTAQRRREISIRTALGAGGRRVIRQLLTESLV